MKIRKFKIFLEENKIFFETLVMFCLTIMSLIISYVGLKIEQEANKIAEHQIEIQDAQNLPSFIFESKYDENAKIEYFYIKNTGGDIRYGTMDLLKVLEIKSMNYDTNQQYNIDIILVNYFDAQFGSYNFEQKQFTFSKSNSYPILKDIIENSERLIESKGFQCSTSLSDICLSNIIDYKGQQELTYYQNFGGGLYEIPFGTNTNSTIYFDINEMEPDVIYNILDRELENLLKK